MGNVFIDAPKPRGSKYVQTPLQGRVIEQYSPGFLQVDIEGSLIDVAAAPGVYGVGAIVTVERGLDGRPTRVVPPQSLPDGVEPLGVGVTGETTLEAKATADQAATDALDALDDAARASNAAADALNEARKAWDEASAARESIVEVDTSAKAAQAAAHNAEIAAQLTQQALDAAKEAQRLENEALRGAASEAKTTADSAVSKAGAADGKATAAQAAAQDAQAKADSLHLQAENKCPNWSFETGFQPWGSNFGLSKNHIVGVSDAWHGEKVVQSTIGSSVFHWIFLPFENAVPTEPGRVWEARARVRTVGGEGRAYAGFRAYYPNDKWMTPGTSLPGLEDGQWETVTYRYESTSAAVRVTPLIGVAAERGTVFQIDAVELRDVTEAVAAQAVADAAKEDAGRAQSTADAAKADAGKAQAAADAARARADELAKQAQDAMTAAQQAQTSADGKALVAYSDYQPATIAGQKIIWFKPGSVPMLFDGDEWRSVQPGDGVVEALDIGTATVGELSGMRIKAGTASVDILIPGENARWTSSGLTIYHPLTPEQQQAGIDPTDWDNRSVALNLTSEGTRFISVADETGTVTAYMSPQGEVSGRELTITGAAAVDTLEVGGLDLEDWLGTRQLMPVGMTVLPGLDHPEGTQTVHMGWTDITLPPGRYMVEWMPSLRRRSGDDTDAYGAYLEWNYVTGVMQPFEGGSTRIAGWNGGGPYAGSVLRGVFTVEDNDTGLRDIKIFYGIHSYYQNRILAEYPSVVLLSRVPDELEMSYQLVKFSTTPTPPPPAKTYTTTARLSDIYFAYGSTFAQSGSYQSGGIFRLPAVKGRQVVSIKVTGKGNFDFADGGQGRSFPFYLGGETKSYFLRDFGTVKLIGGTRAGSNLSNNGLLNFAASSGAPVYTTYDPSSFRCTVTYK